MRRSQLSLVGLAVTLVGAAALLALVLVGKKSEPPSGWEILVETHDTNGDGKIADNEYTRGRQGFQRLDVDHDGWITEADLSSPARSQRAMASLMGDVVGWLADQNKDHTVTLAEWRATIDALDPDRNGIAEPEALSKTGLQDSMRDGIVGMFDRDENRTLEVAELEAVFRQLDHDNDTMLKGDEIVNWRASLLEVGDPAPIFELPRADDPRTTVRLADFRGKRPVALIFGSFT